jgi:hypothetical protein
MPVADWLLRGGAPAKKSPGTLPGTDGDRVPNSALPELTGVSFNELAADGGCPSASWARLPTPLNAEEFVAGRGLLAMTCEF